jgi:chromosome segregation ATPase
LTELIAKHKAEIEDLKSKHEKEIENLHNSYSVKLKSLEEGLKQEHQKDKSEMMSQHKAKLEDSEKKHEENIKALTSDYDKKLNQKVKENEENMKAKSQEISQIKKEKEKTEKDMNDRIRLLEGSLHEANKKIENLTDEGTRLTKTIKESEATISELRKENAHVKEEFASLKDKLMIEFEQKEKDLNAKLHDKMEAFKSVSLNEFEKIKAEYMETLGLMENKTNSLRKE